MKRSTRYSILSFFLSFLIVLPCLSRERSQNDMENFLKITRELDAAWDSMNNEKILQFYADDATFLAPGGDMIRGKQALRESLESWSSVKIDFVREKVEIKILGECAYELVNQTAKFQLENQEPQQMLQKYVHVWKKQNDGSWKILIDMWNSCE